MSAPVEAWSDGADCKFDVLLTSYEVAMADFSVLTKTAWSTLVVDEGVCGCHSVGMRDETMGGIEEGCGETTNAYTHWSLSIMRVYLYVSYTGHRLKNNKSKLFQLLKQLDTGHRCVKRAFRQSCILSCFACGAERVCDWIRRLWFFFCVCVRV
jgi:hypothetical protein